MSLLRRRCDLAPGKVYLVGAGPGDPELVTLKAMRLLKDADVVLFDRLSNPSIIQGLKAELIDVGKTAGRHKLTQGEINDLLIKKAMEGYNVVRLKGGDPYVFGRGGEEALALIERNIAFEVVPGVTSAVSVPELAGIPVTHRGVSTALTIVTGHEETGKERPLDWSALARLGGTLVVLMGVARLEENTKALIASGKDPKTPAAIIEKGGWPEQRAVYGNLGDIADKAREEKVEPPAILVVGDVVRLGKVLGPLKLAIFRTDGQIDESVAMAERYGFKAIPAPAIALKRLPLPDDLEDRIKTADWVVFTSSNGVEAALKDERLIQSLSQTKIAAIGPMTARALQESCIEVSLIPKEYSSAGLVDALSQANKVVLLRSAKGSPTLINGLKAKGVDVDDVALYDLIGSGDKRLDDLITKAKDVDIFAFTSGSTSRYLIGRAKEMGLEGELRSALARSQVVAIGPPTAEELRRLGIRVDLIPTNYTFEDMLSAISKAVRN